MPVTATTATPVSAYAGEATMHGRSILCVYLTGGDSARDAMPRIATTLGLDPNQGAAPTRVTAGTRLHADSSGWVALQAPDGQMWQLPATRPLGAAHSGEAALVVSYLPWDSSHTGAEEHCNRSLDAGHAAIGIIPIAMH